MSKRIVQYTVLQGTAAELNAQVNAMIAQGWEPLGGVAIAANRMSIGRLDLSYSQAMVFYADISPAASATPPSGPPPPPSSIPPVRPPGAP